MKNKDFLLRQRFLELRENKGLSVSELALKSGISKQDILKMEKGLKTITIEEMGILLAALEVSLDELLEIQPKENKEFIMSIKSSLYKEKEDIATKKLSLLLDSLGVQEKIYKESK